MNMLQAIQTGAAETLAAQRRAATLPCPCCGTDAPLPYRILGVGPFRIDCEWEDCAKPLCVEGDTAAEALANWNARITPDFIEAIGNGSMK